MLIAPFGESLFLDTIAFILKYSSSFMKILNFKNNSNIWQARKILKKILEENFGEGLGRAVKVPIIEQLLNNKIMGPLSETQKTVSETACLIRVIKKSSFDRFSSHFKLFIIEFLSIFRAFQKFESLISTCF